MSVLSVELLAEVLEERVGQLLVEAAVAQGQEAHVLLDDVTGRRHVLIDLKVKRALDSLEEVLPRLDGALDGRRRGQRLEEPLGLVLVVHHILAQLRTQK